MAPHRRCAGLVLALLATVTAPLAAQEGGLVVEVQGQRSILTAGELAALARDTVRVPFRDTTSHLYQGIPLHAVLARAGVHADAMRGRRQVGRRVVLEAADGYRVVLSLAEADPTLADRVLLLADRVDGMALPAEEGPWRLVMRGDPRHARWIRNVAVVQVLDEGGP